MPKKKNFFFLHEDVGLDVTSAFIMMKYALCVFW
jgi:hypothetical protein